MKNEVETTVRFIEQQPVHQFSDKFLKSRINPASCSIKVAFEDVGLSLVVLLAVVEI